MKNLVVLLAIVVQLILLPSVSKGISSKYEKCVMTDVQKKFDVLPGLGWDNLENVEKGRVLDLNFSKCHFSDDNKYLLPSDVFLVPKKASQVELYSETFDHYFNYTSTLSRSMKVEASGVFHSFELGAKFSDESSEVKTYQLESRSKITRVQLRYNIYKSKIEPDSPLSQSFKDRIIHLAKWIKIYNDTLYHSYLADMIIKDFGTHVIRSIDAGAVLSKTDLLDQNYVRQYSSVSNTISSSASASFLEFFKLSAEYQTRATTEQVNVYNKNTVKTIIKTNGGMVFGPQMGMDRWIQAVNDNLVAIDRSGDPIYYVLSRKVLPMLSSNIIHKISNLLQDSVNRYYSANTRKGCVDFQSVNFNPDANVDDGTCISPTVNFNFGGIYETCEGPDDQCRLIQNPNPLTGTYSCPDGFSSVMLHQGLNECREICWRYWLFWKKCRTDCSHFKIFWCYPEKFGLNRNGYRFGGFIGNEMSVCPLGYYEMKLGSIARLCVSNSVSPKDQNAVEFGGLYSCIVGNPLAQSFFKDAEGKVQRSPPVSSDKWIRDCAEGYVAHVATIDQNCQISFCTETNKFSLGPKPILRRLPFFKISVNLNQSTPKYLYSAKGELFIQNFNPNELNIQAIATGNYVLSAIVVVLIIAFVISGIVILIRRRNRRKRYSLLAKSDTSDNVRSEYGAIQ